MEKEVALNMNKVLILDAGPLINLSMNGLLEIFEKIKSQNIAIAITSHVYQEVVNRPLNIPRFELGALKIKELIDKKIIQFPEEIGINSQELEQETQRLLRIANSTIRTENMDIEVVSVAETSCLALSTLLTNKKIENIIAIDERTTRVLFEKPENLKELMSNKLHRKISLNLNEIKNMNKFRFIRSSELFYIAYKKGFIQLNDKRALEALLYAAKYKGCSISWEEIEQLKRL